MLRYIIIIVSAMIVSILPAQTAPKSIIGVSSWYGTNEQGRKMANGDPFDRNSYTAASRTLPFGTNLLVVNLATKKSVIVKVTDRGPWVKGRILDLAERPAKAIGCDGLCKVSITPIGAVLI